MNGSDGGKSVAIFLTKRSDTRNRGTRSGILCGWFVLKTQSAKSMMNVVIFMAMGEKYAPIDFMTAVEEAPSHPLAAKLTPRELQVLKGLTEGKSKKEIDRDPDITEPPIKLHTITLHRKVGAANHTQAALIAREAGRFRPTRSGRFHAPMS